MKSKERDISLSTSGRGGKMRGAGDAAGVNDTKSGIRVEVRTS